MNDPNPPLPAADDESAAGVRHRKDGSALTQTTVLDALPAHVALLDGSGRILVVNEAWRRFGRDNGLALPDAGVGSVYPGLLGPVSGDGTDDASAVAEGLRAVLAGRRDLFALEYPCHSPQTQRWFRLTAVPLPDGHRDGAVVMHVDVTERKLAEQTTRLLATELEAERSRLVEAQAIARFGSWDTDLATGNVTWSEQTHRIFGTDPAGFTPTHSGFLQFVHADDRAAVDEAFVRSLGESTPRHIEHRVQRPDGSIRHVEERWQVFRDETGVPRRALGTCQDITERRLAEQELRRSQALVDLAGRMARLGAWSIDLPSMAARWSDEAAALHDEAPGHQPTMEQALAYFGDADRQAVQTAVARCAEQGEPFDIEHPITTAAGRQRWLRIIGQPEHDAGGRIVRVHGAVQDVTERWRHQQELLELNAGLEQRVRERTAELTQARLEAEQASRAKSAFLAAMSHEIRTPMNGIIGMVDVLHQTSLKGHQVEMVDLILESAVSLLGIIDDILDFSKIEAERLDLDLAPMPLADVVEKVCGMLDHGAGRRDVQLSVFVDPAIPPLLLADEARLRQVLVNLVGNAVKFSSGRDRPGRVAVRALLRHRTAAAVQLSLVVADNGIGIDEPTLARLFTPFEQADSSTTRRYGGTGLGLAISRNLVDLMGGRIEVQSAPGQGARFEVRLELPVVETEAPPEPCAAVLAGLPCAVIGTEQPLAADLEAVLSHAGLAVQRFDDGAAALAAAPAMQAASPQTPLLWLLLPGQDGTEFEWLRQATAGRALHQPGAVMLGHGRRRGPRRAGAGMVQVDIDALPRRSLFQALALAADLAPAAPGHDDGPEAAATAGAARAPSRDEALRQGRLVLVAEDNATNRQVIRRQLGLIGVAADLAVNGREALARWRSTPYAMLLTDLHMPEMDGYELAATIRAEQPPGRSRPIVALTANALHEVTQRCREAGIDATLIKPVRLPQLRAAIEQWLPLREAPPSAGGAATDPAPDLAPAAAAAGAVDLQVLKALVGDDPAVLDEVLQIFHGSATTSGAALCAAVHAGALRAAGDAAHRLKSAAWSVGARQLGDLCGAIEGAAGSGRADDVATLLPRFEKALFEVMDFLAARGIAPPPAASQVASA